MAEAVKKLKLRLDPAHPVEFNVTSLSVHVAVYRFWEKRGDGDWQIIADGETADNIPDNFQREPYEPGDKIHYWLGIGGTPKTNFSALVTLSQQGRIVPDGAIPETGRTDDAGVAERQTEITVQ